MAGINQRIIFPERQIFNRPLILWLKGKYTADGTDGTIGIIITLTRSFLAIVLFAGTFHWHFHLHAGHFCAGSIFRFFTSITYFQMKGGDFCQENGKRKK
ncbi:MAG: hypothetical protein Q8941_10010 [Bacteroidota bacterium]|nr:hypothetical protein [Bacteroidota bacterium]